MTTLISILIQKYWTILLPVFDKYWKISIPIFFCLILLFYLTTIPFGSNKFTLGVGAIMSFCAYSIIEFFFSKRKSIEVVNAYSEKPTENEDGKKAVPTLIKNSLKFVIPKKIKLNQKGKITITIDSVRSVVRLAKNEKHIKNIRTGNFSLSITSTDMKISPSEPINLSELGGDFPINFNWTINSESLGKKEITVHPSRELSAYLGISPRKSSSWVETIRVVESIGWSTQQLKFLKYGLLVLGIMLSVPLMVPAFSHVIDEVVDNPEELDALVAQEFEVLEEIKKDERLYLDNEDIQWHLNRLGEYREIKDRIKKETHPSPSHKLFWLKFKAYEHGIYAKFRRSFVRNLTNQDTGIVYRMSEENRSLFCISNQFQDSLFREDFIKNKRDTLEYFRFSRMCLTLEPNEITDCLKEVRLHQD